MQTQPYKNLGHEELRVPDRRIGFPEVGTTSTLRKLSNASVDRLNELKERLSNELVAEYRDLVNPLLVRQAVQEANSLAWTTPFPSLLFPVLAEEKVQSAHEWTQRQRMIRERPLVFAA